MRLLLDTHMALWLAQGSSELSAGECELIESATTLAVSAVSLWELRLKWNSRFASGGRKGPADPVLIRKALLDENCEFIALSDEMAVTPLITPLNHSDPFDEMLLVQAQCMGMRLLTRDHALIDHPLAMSG